MATISVLPIGFTWLLSPPPSSGASAFQSLTMEWRTIVLLSTGIIYRCSNERTLCAGLIQGFPTIPLSQLVRWNKLPPSSVYYYQHPDTHVTSIVPLNSSAKLINNRYNSFTRLHGTVFRREQQTMGRLLVVLHGRVVPWLWRARKTCV